MAPPDVQAEDSWSPHIDIVQIRKDIPRSFPEQPVIATSSHIIESILVEHAKFDPELGYCQGMSCVAAVIASRLTNPAEASMFFRRLVESLRGRWRALLPWIRCFDPTCRDCTANLSYWV